jgi:predicted CoA-binding protein
MKYNKAEIEDFVHQKKIAVVGVSRQTKKFGSYVFKELSNKGYDVYAVNPHLEKFENHTCYKTLRDIPEQIDGAILVVKPEETDAIVRDAAAVGVPRVWFQQGSVSLSAVKYCEENSIKVVADKCILMFVPPVSSIHRFHRFIWSIFHR